MCVVIIGGMTGCASPAKRAERHAAAFHRLSRSDQRLVLRGRVRQGLDQEAVMIAWGVPDQQNGIGTSPGGKDTGKTEIWTYRRQVTMYGPIGSYDQWQPGNSFVQPSAPRYTIPGYGFGGIGYEGLLLYRPRVRYVDSYVRRAAFVDGKLAEYQTWYGEYSPLP